MNDLIKATSRKNEKNISPEKFLATVNVLSLNDKGFHYIENLNLCFNLKTLHLYGNHLSKIEGFEKLKKLAVLHLENNDIDKLDNLEGLVSLEKLYLNKNKISRLEGLENCKNL